MQCVELLWYFCLTNATIGVPPCPGIGPLPQSLAARDAGMPALLGYCLTNGPM